MRMKPAKNVDAYIASFPKERQAPLESMRRTIQEAVPASQETISYGMPLFKFHGALLYFAAFKEHYSLFAAGPVDGLRRAFKERLARYQGSKGTIRFPLGEPIPVPLIRAIARYRAKENLARAAKKK